MHYPDGMFYADTKARFGVEYYGVHAEWFCDVIRSGDFTQYRPHTYDVVKYLRNFPRITIVGRRSQTNGLLRGQRDFNAHPSICR